MKSAEVVVNLQRTVTVRLLAVMIPLGSGYAVLGRLRATAELASTPAVLMNCVPPPTGR